MESPSLPPPVTKPAGPGFRYACFISYRHADLDRQWALWLHNALETYRVPIPLLRQGGIPHRLGRVFLDEKELAASANLSDDIVQALTESRFLLVICSPRTPESKWVNKEIETFRALGRHNSILALLIEGEPNQSFPPALVQIRRQEIGPEGQGPERTQLVEPLAADVRPRPGESPRLRKRRALMQILARLLGVRFDDLRQRDQERTTRRLAVLSAVLALLMVVVGALALFAWHQRDEAVAKGEAARIAQGKAEDAAAKERVANDRLRHESVHQLVAAGLAAQQQGRFDAPAWFAAALGKAKDFWPEQRALNRVRLQVALRYGPKVQGILFHDRPVTAYEFDRAGQQILTATDTEACVWGREGQRLHRFPLSHPLRSAEFAPDGRRLLTLDTANQVRIWPLQPGTEEGRITVEKGRAEAALWDATGQHALIGIHRQSLNGKLAIVLQWWAAPAGVVWESEERGYHGPLIQWAVSPNPERPLVAATGDQFLCVWDRDHGGTDRKGGILFEQPLKVTAPHLAFDPTGHWLAVGDEAGQVQVWDLEKREPLYPRPIIHAEPLRDLGFVQNGASLAVNTAQGSSFVFQTLTGARVAQFPRPVRLPGPHPKRTPDEKVGLTALNDHTVRLVDLSWLQPQAEWRHTFPADQRLILSPDGRFAATLGMDSVPNLFEIATGERRWSLAPDPKAPRGVVALAFRGNQSLEAIGLQRGADQRTPFRMSLPLGEKAPEPDARPNQRPLVALAYSGDGRLEATGDANLDVEVRRDGVPFSRFRIDRPEPPKPGWMEFSPDGRYLMVVSNAAPAPGGMATRLWDLQTGQLRVRFEGTLFTVPAFSPDGRWLVAADPEGGRVRWWETATGTERRPLALRRAIAARFAPKGDRVACASKEGRGLLCDVEPGGTLTIRRQVENRHGLNGVSFSPDGRWLALAGEDGTAEVLDAATGEWIASFRHGPPVQVVAFTPDGQRLLTLAGQVRGENTLACWDLHDDPSWDDAALEQATALMAAAWIREDALVPMGRAQAERVWQQLQPRLGRPRP